MKEGIYDRAKKMRHRKMMIGKRGSDERDTNWDKKRSRRGREKGEAGLDAS